MSINPHAYELHFGHMTLMGCHVISQADSQIHALEDFLSKPQDKDVTMDTAQKLLEVYEPKMETLESIYPSVKPLGMWVAYQRALDHETWSLVWKFPPQCMHTLF